MDLVGIFSDEEFECLSNMDDNDFMSQFQNVQGGMFSNSHDDHNLFNTIEISPPSLFPLSNEAILDNNNNIALNFFQNFEINENSYISHQESSNSSGSDDQVMNFQDHDVNFLLATIDHNMSDESVDFYVVDNINDDNMGVKVEAISNDGGKINTMIDDDVDVKGKISKRSSQEAILKEKPKKKARVPRDNAPKNKKYGEKTKKNKKITLENANNNIISNTNNNENKKESGGEEMMRSPSFQTMSSEEDSIVSVYHEGSNGGETIKDSLASKGKTRDSRGNATDPQSLYARKRRERINERLKLLQNLIPNGTKVDISTMLEEAVHYVNFLQFQIKLLSSDEMWMYAPLAYNGIDVGVYQKLFPNL